MKKKQAESTCKASEESTFAGSLLGGTLGEKKNLIRDDLDKHKMKNSMRVDERKANIKKKSNNSVIEKKLLFAHNIGWKFPLKSSCKIPFSKDLKRTGLKNNSQYLHSSVQGFVRQTTKNLIVFPVQIPGPLSVGSAKQLLAQSRARAFAFVRSLQVSSPGLRVYAALAEPITKEFAVKDAFAERVKFTFKASNGIKIDKSVHRDESGHRVTGKELDFVTVEQADEYCNLPNHFKDAVKLFSQSLASYNANIQLHLSTLEDMRDALKEMSKPPRIRHFRKSAKKSATYRACS